MNATMEEETKTHYGKYVVWSISAVVIVAFALAWGMGWVKFSSRAPMPVYDGTPLVPGASSVGEGGQVLTPEGNPVRLDVEPGNPEAPFQSSPIAPEELPEAAVKLTASFEGKFSPREFTVTRGQLVTLSLTSGDEKTYVLRFRDPSLSAVALGVGPNETRAITFNAPGPGEYEFFSDVPGQAEIGFVGKMIVK